MADRTNSFGKSVKIGAIFFGALVLLGYFTLTVTDIPLFEEAYYYTVEFDNTGGLKVGDPVQVLGMTVGAVRDMRIEDNKVLVELKLDYDLAIHEDYAVTSEELSAIGGRFILIIPGTTGRPEIPRNSLLKGKNRGGFSALGQVADDNGPAFARIVDNVEAITQDIKDAKGTIGILVSKSELYDEAMRTVEEFKKTGTELNSVINDIKSGSGTIGKLVYDTKAYDDLVKTIEEAKAVIEGVKQGKGTLGMLLADNDTSAKLDKIIDNVTAASENLKSITEKIDRGDGTVSKIINDDSLYNKVDQTLDSVDKLLAPALKTRVDLGVQYKIYPDSDMSISKVYLKLYPNEDRYFMVGAAFISLDPESDTVLFENQIERGDGQMIVKPEIMLAWDFLDDKFNARVGLLEGQFGGAVDWNFELPLDAHPARFTLEARNSYNDVHDQQFDEQVRGTLLRAELSTAFWEDRFRVHMGVNRLFEDAEFYGGLSFEYTDKDIKSFVSLIGLGF